MQNFVTAKKLQNFVTTTKTNRPQKLKIVLKTDKFVSKIEETFLKAKISSSKMNPPTP